MSESGFDYGSGQETLVKASGMVQEAKSDFTRISSKLSDQISGVQGKWGGQGASAFFSLHQAWTEKQKIIVSALDEFSNALTVTDKEAKGNDETQSSNYSKLTGRLG
ncbi:MAG: WXG100 family type VII secretion target [Nocardioides sp.]